MSTKILKDGKEITITHTMADGTIRDSINGYEVPYNETTSTAYQLISQAQEKLLKNIKR